MNSDPSARQAEAIGIFFPVPEQEKVALRLARMLEHFAPDSIPALRPETTLDQIFNWAESGGADTVEFVLCLEHELGVELDDDVADHLDQITFRDLVEHATE